MKYIKTENGIVTKGDTDVEVTKEVFNTMQDIDLICLVTGDSDFFSAIDDWHSKGKYIQVYSYKHIMAREIVKFCIEKKGASFTYIDGLRNELEFRP